MRNAWIFITNRCNLDCSYCYIKKQARDIEAETAHRILEYILDDPFFDQHHIVLFGGEPLLKPDLIEDIVRFGYKQASKNKKILTFSIYTNGTLLTQSVLNSLFELGVGVDLSLDGIKESHNLSRPFKNSFESFSTIEKKIPMLLQRYPFSMVHACITPANVKYLSENFRYFIDCGFKRILCQPVLSLNWTGTDYEIFRVQLNKTFELYAKLINQSQKIYFNLFEEYEKVKSGDSKTCNDGTPCPAGIQNFAFSVDGDIYPCHRFATLKYEKGFKAKTSSFKLGNINDPERINNMPLFKRFLFFSYKRNKTCGGCSVKETCRYCCHWEHFYKYKTYEKINTTVCEIQKIIINSVDHFCKRYPALKNVKLAEFYHQKNIPLLN